MKSTSFTGLYFKVYLSEMVEISTGDIKTCLLYSQCCLKISYCNLTSVRGMCLCV